MNRMLALLIIVAILACFSGCNDISYSDTKKDISGDENHITVKEISSEEELEDSAGDDEDYGNSVSEDDKQNTLIEDDVASDAGISISDEQNEDDEAFSSKEKESEDAPPVADEAKSDIPENEENDTPNSEEAPLKIDGYTEPVKLPVDIKNEADVLSKSPAPRLELLNPEASGILQVSNEYAVIDYSNTSCGYVMVKYTEPCESRIKAQLKGASATYTYNITPGQWEVFPLSLGGGEYTLTVYQNVVDSKYATVLSASFDAVINDEFTVFLYPNQYVNYSCAPKTVDMAYELTKYEEDTLMKLSAVYDFVINTIVYDKEKAKSVVSGYLPVLDSVLESKKGICFDYAALMTGMLRSQGIPCKLVVGYAGSAYHAWISVWTENSGWIDGAIYFDGVSWHRMDPTFASSSGKSDTIMQYIGDGKNYTEKYLY